MIQVCKRGCENKPFEVQVKKSTQTFCCEKGFKKSLKAFSKSIKSKIKQTL